MECLRLLRADIVVMRQMRRMIVKGIVMGWELTMWRMRIIHFDVVFVRMGVVTRARFYAICGLIVERDLFNVDFAILLLLPRYIYNAFKSSFAKTHCYPFSEKNCKDGHL